MRFGLCTALENFTLAEKLGFDYIECSVSAIEAIDDTSFKKALDIAISSSIKMERANVLFPGSIITYPTATRIY